MDTPEKSMTSQRYCTRPRASAQRAQPMREAPAKRIVFSRNTLSHRTNGIVTKTKLEGPEVPCVALWCKQPMANTPHASSSYRRVRSPTQVQLSVKM